MISYDEAMDLFKKIHRNPFKIVNRLKKVEGKHLKPIQWSKEEVDSLEYAVNVIFFEFLQRSENEKIEDVQVKFRIIGALCDESRKLLRQRENVKKTISYEYDIDADLVDPNSADAFKNIETMILLKQTCDEIRKPKQNLFDALISFSQNKNIQFESFGMSRRMFFYLRQKVFSKMQKNL